MEISINYVAVICAAVANMIVGFLWYGPVFGKPWKKMMGFTDEVMKAMTLKPWQAILGGCVTALIMAYVLAHVAVVFGAQGVSGALMLGFWMWLGFSATILASSFLWEGKPLALYLFNAAQGLVSLIAMSMIIVLWA